MSEDACMLANSSQQVLPPELKGMPYIICHL